MFWVLFFIFIFFVMGIKSLLRGKFYLTSQKTIVGIYARLLGVLFLIGSILPFVINEALVVMVILPLGYVLCLFIINKGIDRGATPQTESLMKRLLIGVPFLFLIIVFAIATQFLSTQS